MSKFAGAHCKVQPVADIHRGGTQSTAPTTGLLIVGILKSGILNCSISFY